MKAVMLSIRPEWCEKIISGKKTVEVRKTMPKLETPFKCYIYQTKPKYGDWNERHGRVIGEFVCDDCSLLSKEHYGYIEKHGRLSVQELKKYMDIPEGRELEYSDGCYGWHISDLVIYDYPKELSEFYVWKKCDSCRKSGYESTACGYDENCKVPATITSPPQSWRYVEELLGGNE